MFGRYDQAKLSKDVAPDLKDKYLNIGVAYKPIKALDFALVYKNEKVNNGSTSISGADANGSYAIGGANHTRNGTFDELGMPNGSSKGSFGSALRDCNKTVI